jgi:hypothetical protein
VINVDQYLGIVENGRFTVLIPEAAGCCSVKLTKLEHPSIPETDAVRQHEINLTDLEGKALMVKGSLPKFEGWLYEASVVEEASPILTMVVKELFGKK